MFDIYTLERVGLLDDYASPPYWKTVFLLVYIATWKRQPPDPVPFSWPCDLFTLCINWQCFSAFVMTWWSGLLPAKRVVCICLFPCLLAWAIKNWKRKTQNLFFLCTDVRYSNGIWDEFYYRLFIDLGLILLCIILSGINSHLVHQHTVSSSLSSYASSMWIERCASACTTPKGECGFLCTNDHTWP